MGRLLSVMLSIWTVENDRAENGVGVANWMGGIDMGMVSRNVEKGASTCKAKVFKSEGENQNLGLTS